jgi:hypothetical protein
MRNFVDSQITSELWALMSENWPRPTIFTHCGKPHGDDACTVAAASMLLGDPKSLDICRIDDDELVTRTANGKSLIVDIGKGRFDHHFRDEPEKREYYSNYFWEKVNDNGTVVQNPIEKASIAKFWEYAGPEIVHETILRTLEREPIDSICCTVAEEIEKSFISKLSDTDTRGQIAAPNEYSRIVSNRYESTVALIEFVFEKESDDFKNNRLKIETDVLFSDLVDFFREELTSRIIISYTRFFQKLKAEEEAKTVANTHPYWITLDKFIPAFLFAETDVRFIVYKSNRNDKDWNVNAVDNAKFPIKNEVIKDIDGFKIQPIAPLAVFTNKEAAEKAAELLTK